MQCLTGCGAEPEAGDLELAVKALQDSLSDLSQEHLKLREASALLEQRVRQLERGVLSGEPAEEGAAAGDARRGAGEAKALKVGERQPGPSKVEPSAGGKAGRVQSEAKEGVSADDLDDECQEVPLAPSSWDACLLVGSPALGLWGSLATILCILVNVSIQMIFCAIVYANMIDAEFQPEDLEGLKAWRFRVAHDDRYKSLAGISLASRVCGQDPTLEVSNEQAAKVGLIRDYTPSLDPQLAAAPVLSKDWMRTYFDGSLMSLLAVTCWILTVSKEIGSVFDLVGVIVSLPGGRSQRVCVASSNDSTEVVSAGCCSKAFMLLVTGMRLSVALLLLAMGVLYVVYTSSIQDLLLNAVALECIMAVDELTFEALAPRRARQILARLAPLKLPPWRNRLRALDVKSLVLFASLAGMLTGVWFGPLRNHRENLELAHAALCNGALNFTVYADQFGMVHSQSAVAFEDEASTPLRPQELAVLENMQGTRLESRAYTLDPITYGFENLQKLRAANQLELTEGLYTPFAPLGCHDVLDTVVNSSVHDFLLPWHTMLPQLRTQKRVWLRYMNDMAGGRGMGSSQRSSCPDFLPFCFEPMVHTLCPRTCECDSLLRGAPWDRRGAGCPSICRQTVDPREKRTASCSDASHRNASDPKSQILQFWGSLVGDFIERTLADYGCMGIVHGDLKFLCSPPTWLSPSTTRTSFKPTDLAHLKLLTFLCPETCNCGGRAQGAAALYMNGTRPPRASCPDSCE